MRPSQDLWSQHANSVSVVGAEWTCQVRISTIKYWTLFKKTKNKCGTFAVFCSYRNADCLQEEHEGCTISSANKIYYKTCPGYKHYITHTCLCSCLLLSIENPCVHTHRHTIIIDFHNAKKNTFNAKTYLWGYLPGAPQSAQTLLPGCRTKSNRILLFLSRLAISESCQTDAGIKTKELPGKNSIMSPHMLGSTAAGKNHNFFLVVCRSASVFPLTSTTPWSLLFCTEMQRSRNNSERKWNGSHCVKGWLTYNHRVKDS